MALTGKIHFRKTWLGGLALLVEEDVTPRFSRKVKQRWRRATAMDLAQPELRVLVDMRSRAHIGSCASMPVLPPRISRGASLSDDAAELGAPARMTH